MRRVLAWSTEHKLLAVIAVLCFTVSFRALHDVAVVAGWGELAPMLPLMIDGTAITAALVVDRLGSRRARLYPWTIVVLLAVGSSVLNALHNPALVLTPVQRGSVNFLPPVLLALTFHLIRRVKVEDVRMAARRAKLARVSPAAGTAGAVTSPPSRRIGPTTRMPQVRSAGTRSPRRDEAWAWLEEHHGARAVDLQAALGVTQSTASRWVRQWHEQGPRLAAVNQ